MIHISLRKIAAVVLCALCISFCYSQEDGAVRASDAPITLSTPESAISIAVSATDAGANLVQTDSPSSVWLFIRMILVLLIVVALIYGVVLLMKKGISPGAEDDPFLRKVSQITLSPGKSVQIVTLFNHAYLVGVTDGAINLLGEITDQELVDSMNLYADQHTNVKKPRSFADILNIFMPNGPRGEATTVFGNSAQTTAENLRLQRERLNGDESGVSQ